MKIIAIHYPDGVELDGWDKAVFERRMRRIFEREHFSVCELDRCRSTIKGTGDCPPRNENDELSAFHCVDYEDLTSDERGMLVKKVEAFIGVGLTIKPYEARRIRIAKAIAAVIMACIGIALIIHQAKHVVDRTGTLEGAMPEAAAAFLPTVPLPSVNRAQAPTFDVSVTTYAASAAIKQISNLIRNDGKGYVVSVTATPLSDKHEEK